MRSDPLTAESNTKVSPTPSSNGSARARLVSCAHREDALPDLLGRGVVWIQWRVENVNIVPVFGKGAQSRTVTFTVPKGASPDRAH